MKLIETRVHGYLDYIVAVLMIASPWLFNFAAGGAETWVPVVLGVGVIFYSLMTDYELGISPQLSMRTHLLLDMITGILLIVSPWLFGFSNYVWTPHVIMGLLDTAVTALTKRVPKRERRTHRKATVSLD